MLAVPASVFSDRILYSIFSMFNFGVDESDQV